jgi:hypothetical protein
MAENINNTAATKTAQVCGDHGGDISQLAVPPQSDGLLAHALFFWPDNELPSNMNNLRY